MKLRRPGRARRKDRQMWAAQHWRLLEIAAGRLRPHFEHEILFRWTLDHRGVANPQAFILPAMLFLAATVTKPLARASSEAPALTAPRPAPVVPSPPPA